MISMTLTTTMTSRIFMPFIRSVNRGALPLLLLTATLFGLSKPAMAETVLTIMSFNTWGAGTNDSQPLEHTVAAIRAADPDLVGLQEIRAEASGCAADECPPDQSSVAPELAEALGYHLLEQLADNEVLWANAILSRYPIVGPTPGGLGARIDVDGREVLLFNIHATDFPYQPFQLLDIPYGDAPFLDTAAEAVTAAREARRGALALLFADIEAAGAAELIAVTGDFNEPSHRDWTADAVSAGLQPLVVDWPFTRALEAAGFTDAFRAAHPDEVARPGFTWSPLIGEDDSGDHRDRIDYVFVQAPTLRIESVKVVGEPGPWTDVAVAPWPSDHRAVAARVKF